MFAFVAAVHQAGGFLIDIIVCVVPFDFSHSIEYVEFRYMYLLVPSPGVCDVR